MNGAHSRVAGCSCVAARFLKPHTAVRATPRRRSLRHPSPSTRRVEIFLELPLTGGALGGDEAGRSAGSFLNKCSILLYQKRTGELRLVRATIPQLASHNRKPITSDPSGVPHFSVPREQPGYSPRFHLRLALFSVRWDVTWPLLSTGPVGISCGHSPVSPRAATNGLNTLQTTCQKEIGDRKNWKWDRRPRSLGTFPIFVAERHKNREGPPKGSPIAYCPSLEKRESRRGSRVRRKATEGKQCVLVALGRLLQILELDLVQAAVEGASR
jgi:hypothetical protein